MNYENRLLSEWRWQSAIHCKTGTSSSNYLSKSLNISESYVRIIWIFESNQVERAIFLGLCWSPKWMICIRIIFPSMIQLLILLRCEKLNFSSSYTLTFAPRFDCGLDAMIAYIKIDTTWLNAVNEHRGWTKSAWISDSQITFDRSNHGFDSSSCNVVHSTVHLPIWFWGTEQRLIRTVLSWFEFGSVRFQSSMNMQ